MFGLPDWSLLGGFSSSSYIMLKREDESDENGISHHGNQLLVCIHNKAGSPTLYTTYFLQVALRLAMLLHHMFYLELSMLA